MKTLSSLAICMAASWIAHSLDSVLWAFILGGGAVGLAISVNELITEREEEQRG